MRIVSILLIVVALVSACSSTPSTKGPTPDARPAGQKPPVVQPPPVSPTPAPAPIPPPKQAPSTEEKSLNTILSDYTNKWRKDYPLRVQLAPKCPASKGYSYGMRLIQPASFQGDFAEAVKRKYGNSTDFIVIAVASGFAASKVGIVEGDRVVQISRVRSTQANAGKTIGEQSRRWSTPYDVVLLRNDKEVTVKLKPDLLCEIPL